MTIPFLLAIPPVKAHQAQIYIDNERRDCNTLYTRYQTGMPGSLP